MDEHKPSSVQCLKNKAILCFLVECDMAEIAVQVISLCEKPRDPPLKYVIVDTPGQIEIFTWSASGAIITEAFASGFPTMVAFIIDTPRCAHPQTFMSNMLQVRAAGFVAVANV